MGHTKPQASCLTQYCASSCLKKGGILAFDDYLWEEPLPGGRDPISCPKIVIDSFTNIYCRKLKVISGAPLNQLYISKTSN